MQSKPIYDLLTLMNEGNYTTMLPIGTLLQGGRYRVERYMASGGFGNTYEIVHTKLHRRFALKEFFLKEACMRSNDSRTVTVTNPTQSNAFSTMREKFEKEAQRMYDITQEGCPHVVTVTDLFDENMTSYYVMELVEGESLGNRLKRTGQPISEQEVMALLPQVLDALDGIHHRRIWHLDIKPDNLMVDAQGQVTLIDFGASKQMSAAGGYSHTLSAMCYTPGYAPTEQIDQNIQSIGPWTDFYALGATLYRLLTNETPPSFSELLSGNSAFHFTPAVSNRMQQLILWMMQPVMSNRPQSVADIRSWLSTHTVAPSPNNSEATQVVTPPPVYQESTQVENPNPPRPIGNSYQSHQEVTYEEEEGFWSKWKWPATLGVVAVFALAAVFYFLNDSFGNADERDNEERTELAEAEETESFGEDIRSEKEEKEEEVRTNDVETAKETPRTADEEEQTAKESEAAKKKDSDSNTNTIQDTKKETTTNDGNTKSNTLQGSTENKKTEETDTKVFTAVEQMPSFPGGSGAMLQWMAKNIHYPEAAQEICAQGRVIVGFIVERDGSITGVKVLRSIDPTLDKEAVSLVKRMPRWTPGKQNGQAVRVSYNVPVTFKLQ